MADPFHMFRFTWPAVSQSIWKSPCGTTTENRYMALRSRSCRDYFLLDLPVGLYLIRIPFYTKREMRDNDFDRTSENELWEFLRIVNFRIQVLYV